MYNIIECIIYMVSIKHYTYHTQSNLSYGMFMFHSFLVSSFHPIVTEFPFWYYFCILHHFSLLSILYDKILILLYSKHSLVAIIFFAFPAKKSGKKERKMYIKIWVSHSFDDQIREKISKPLLRYFMKYITYKCIKEAQATLSILHLHLKIYVYHTLFCIYIYEQL